MVEGIIIVVIVLICVVGIKSYAKKLARGCCGAGGEKEEKRVKVQDRNLAHYPYEMHLHVEGMTCSHCVRRVENALNQLDGVWATVSLPEQSADIHMKQAYTPEQLRQAIREAGYTAWQS